jgi:hypothetical protein
MILADFMPLSAAKNERAIINQAAMREAVVLKGRLDAFKLVMGDDATNDETRTLMKMTERTSHRLLERRAEILTKTGTLPDELRLEDDALTLASKTPTVSLADARMIADKLSFLIMPFEYMDDRAVDAEKHAMVTAIRGFAAGLGNWFDIYVLAPIPYYDVRKHVMAKDSLSLYAGSAVAQAFMAITMSIPMFRAILGEVTDLRNRMERVDARVTKAETELQNLARSIKDLQAQAERQQAETILAQKRAAAQQRELEELRARRSFIAYEPMMLAVPKGTSFQADGLAIVGPCWGPDFEDIVLTALGLRKIEGQRAELAKLAIRWGGGQQNDRSNRSYGRHDDR